MTVTLPPLGDPAPNRPAYDRGDWQHWTDDDGDCQNTRHEVLVAESTAPVTFKTGRQCQVATGQWAALYTGATVTDAGSLDVDHLVPLKHAHDSGGWQWDSDRKRQYANDLTAADHLIAVTASANRQKGSQGPAEWKPLNPAAWCQYARAWITVKLTWGLTSTTAEHTALREMLGTCANGGAMVAPVAAPTATPRPLPTATPVPTARPSGGPYANCEAAVAAGEPRVRGSKGNGRGFVAWKVPSARDGDGDGVVCER